MFGNSSPARARLARAAFAAVEGLEGRKLFAVEPASVQTLPFALDWSAGDVGGLADADGADTGFTFAYANKNADEYQPAKINVETDQGLLLLTSSGNAASGSNQDLDNSLVNGLGVQFDATGGPFEVTVRLKGPLSNIDVPQEQAGLLFGPDQDNFIKLVAVASRDGTSVQLRDEQTVDGQVIHALSGDASRTRVGGFGSLRTLDLRLTGDPTTGTIGGAYSVDGRAFVPLAQKVTLPAERRAAFFTAAARAGIVAIHKNDLAPVTVAFDRFSIARPGDDTGPGTDPDPDPDPDTGPPPDADQPSVTESRPGPNQTNVSRDAFVAVDVHLPNLGQGVDDNSLNAATVRLTRVSDGAEVPARVNTSGGADEIVLQPLDLLDPNTKYQFELTGGVTDEGLHPFAPYKITFTTGTAGGVQDASVAFEKVALSNATGQAFTGVTVGPDGKLYAWTLDGKVLRWDVDPATGTLLGKGKVIETVADNNGGARTITGLTFDPASTADNLVAWVTHSQYADNGGQDWTGKVSRLTGDSLQNYRDFVTGLPRSAKDHLTNQSSFGPDGALYLSQGSNSSMGDSDPAWGNRDEHLLSAAVLRIDVAAIAAKGNSAVNVRTNGAGNYDPFKAGATVTLYATGVRNAYDLVWHSNGHLYAPTNGAAAGGSTPSFSGTFSGKRIDSGNGPYNMGEIDGGSDVRSTQPDFLFDVLQGGYYGQPNPSRGEFVLNGGNPSAAVDPHEVPVYPIGTAPDRNYRGPAYVFGRNYSPDGAVEYTGNAFGGRLNGKLLVTRYSGGDDVVAIGLDDQGRVTGVETGIAGLTRFADPLDVTEDRRNGFLYVVEFAEQKITLVRPIAEGARVEVDAGAAGKASGSTPGEISLYFADVADGDAGHVRTVTIRNTGSADLALPTDGLTLFGDDAGQFTILDRPALPNMVKPGESLVLRIAMNASGSVGSVRNAMLTIKTSDPGLSQIDVPLRGLVVAGLSGDDEPSLQRIFDFYDLPISTGDPSPNTTAIDSAPGAGDEILAQRFLKASDDEPVTIEPLAAYAVNTMQALRFGTYTPGTPRSFKELLVVDQADAQSMGPQVRGSLEFDPDGEAFGFYSTYPKFDNREVYSEDALNTWEPDEDHRRKVRVYPLKNPDGTTVENAYVIAFEEFTPRYDSNDFVAIVRNVKPAGAGPSLGVENTDGAPLPDLMAFSRIQDPHPGEGKPDNVVHNRATLLLRNNGDAPLDVTSIDVSGPWELDDDADAGPFTLAAGASREVVVRFTATGNPTGTADRIHEGTLTINSTDPANPSRSIRLRGYWQVRSENKQEPTLSELLHAFGFGTQGLYEGQDLNGGGKLEAIGDEVLSRYWASADGGAVSVRQLNAYHTQGSDATIAWTKKGSRTRNEILTTGGAEGQSFLPHLLDDTDAPAEGVFVPTGVFGLAVGSEYSDDTLNDQEKSGGGWGHHVRFYPAKDAAGTPIPNAWLMTMDYSGINYDYQDNVYLITNIRPELAPAAPTGLAATNTAGGVALTWAAAATDVIGYDVYRAPNAAGPFAKLTSSGRVDPETGTVSYIDDSAEAGASYVYQVIAVSDDGSVQSTPAATQATRPELTQPPPGPDPDPDPGTDPDPDPDPGTDPDPDPGTDPDPGAGEPEPVELTGADLGAPVTAGATTVVDAATGAYDQTGGGVGAVKRADQAQFAQSERSGDFDVQVRLDALTGGKGKNARAGLMARSSLDAGAANVFLNLQPAKRGSAVARLSYRTTDGGKLVAGKKLKLAALAGTWLRLARTGDTFTAYTSADGVTWTQAGTVTPMMPAAVPVGLTTAAGGKKGPAATAQFREFGDVVL